VASHHVESFNFAMDTCLPRINQYMLTAEVAQPKPAPEMAAVSAKKPALPEINYPFNKMNIWFEDFELKKPTRSGGQFQASHVLLDG